MKLSNIHKPFREAYWCVAFVAATKAAYLRTIPMSASACSGD
jgi:hypothetical protein